MAAKSSASANIENRSPFVVEVRSQPVLNRRFSYSNRAKAHRYHEALKAQGHKAQLGQLETSYQLRVRRKGVKVQHITFDSPHEAEQARLQIEADLAVSIVRDYAVAAQVTPRDLMERYGREVVPQHKGAESESYRLRRLLREEAWVDKRLAALTTEDLQDFIAERLTEVAGATVDRDIDLIAQVLHYAGDVWRIAAPISPLKGLRRPRYFNERDRRLSAAEEEALLDAARADENPYIEPAIILALETAMRRGELLALTSDDIDRERRCALVRQSKNGRPRKVPLSRRALEVIDALPATASGRLLDLSANALQLGFFRRVIPAAGIADFHFHDLRHEAISRLAESGRFQLIELQAVSGHRDMRMLQRYAHLCSGNLAAKMDIIREGTVKRYVHRGRKRTVVKVEKWGRPTPTIEDVVVEPSGTRAANIIDFNSQTNRRKKVEHAGTNGCA